MWQTKYSPARPILMERRSLKGCLSDIFAYSTNKVAFEKPLEFMRTLFSFGYRLWSANGLEERCHGGWFLGKYFWKRE